MFEAGRVRDAGSARARSRPEPEPDLEPEPEPGLEPDHGATSSMPFNGRSRQRQTASQTGLSPPRTPFMNFLTAPCQTVL
jgi:hypothetical protein